MSEYFEIWRKSISSIFSLNKIIINALSSKRKKKKDDELIKRTKKFIKLYKKDFDNLSKK